MAAPGGGQRRTKGAAASHHAADEGAKAALKDGGNAIDAVAAGFLCAAAVDPAVLFAPLGAMVAGVGVGARLFDGRSCQAGRGLPRPRGWISEEEVPDAAYAAVPRSIAALALLSAYGGKRPFGALARQARRMARERGAKRRAALIEAVGRQGAQALRSRDVSRALLAAVGPGAGGLLSAADLDEALPGDEPARFSEQRGLGVALPPWPAPSPRPAHVVVAADGSGLVAALAFSPDEGGLAVPELELVLPRDGKPVRRGVPRVAPGTALGAAMPIALLRRRKDGWFAAVGVRGAEPLDAHPLDGAEDSLALRLEAWRAGGIALAAATEHRRVQLTRVAADA